MPVRLVTRPSSRLPVTRVPDALCAGTLVLSGLGTSGFLDAVERRFPLARRGGHGTRSLFSAVVVFLLGGPAWGIRPFLQQNAAALRQVVAPVAGLRTLATSSALSRALGALSHAEVRSFCDWLLPFDNRVGDLLQQANVLHRDAFGDGWHVLDVDPTIEAFRQRPLEQDASLPQGERRSPGEPGYTGHKRGELRVRHIPILHAGTALWLAYRLVPEEGSSVPILAELLKTALASLPVKRTVVRGDGEFGSVGAMRAVSDTGAHYLTRLARYALLDREEVVAAFPRLAWRPVPSSGGGPAREAAELGVFEFHPSDGAVGSGAPVTTRVVVTRFRRASPPDHGVLRDGFQVELFATSLPADAWPAGDVVALYFGRSAIECRFAQEDREFAAHRTFSEHPPGQEWVTGIAYFLWNLMLCEGAAASPALPPPPPQERCPPPQEPCPPPGAPAPVPAPTLPLAAAPPPASCEPLSGSARSEGLENARDPTPDDVTSLAQEVWLLVREAIPLRPQWRLDDDAGVLRCPSGKRHYVFASYLPRPPQATGRILLRGETAACDRCPLWEQCSSHKPGTYKQLWVPVSEADARHAADLLTRARAIRPHRPPRRRTPPPEAPARGGTSSDAMLEPKGGTERVAPGPLRPASPLFLPAEARALTREILRSAAVDVHVGVTVHRTTARHRLVAPDSGARRHRRLTWAQRRSRWAADPIVTIVATGPRSRALQQLLRSVKAPIAPLE